MARAVIMAGGEGTRLRPFTHTIPKPLLPIGRKPVVQLIIERLADCGFTDITMSLGYAADLIRAYFQDGRRFGVKITYYEEREKLGTAGCLSHLPELREGPFLVTNGDLLTDLDYQDLMTRHQQTNATLTVATRTQTLALPYGVLDLKMPDGSPAPPDSASIDKNNSTSSSNDPGNDARITGVREKPNHTYVCNAGIYALSPEAIDHIPTTGPSDMTDLIQRLLAANAEVRPYPLQGFWFDLAEADDFDRALRKLEELGLLP